MCASRSAHAGAGVDQVRVVLDDSGDDLEIRHAAGERIGDGLEDEDGDRLGILDGAFDFLAVQRSPFHGPRSAGPGK